MERAISRTDLLSPRTSPESEPDLEKLLPTPAKEFEYIIPASIPPGPDPNHEDDEEGLSFRLFATSTAATRPDQQDTVTKIKLRSPTPQTTESGFLSPKRPSTYYFADGSRQKEYSTSALSGTEVLSLSRRPWPGSVYEWKVLRLPLSGQIRSARKFSHTQFDRLTDGETRSRKRTRPGKKARVKLRVRLAASRKKSETEKAEAEAKDLAERMKRAKRNREKKFKKRARDKAKKVMAEAETGG